MNLTKPNRLPAFDGGQPPQISMPQLSGLSESTRKEVEALSEDAKKELAAAPSE